MPIPPYRPPFLPIPSVTPFTHRDALTYLERLEAIVKHVNAGFKEVNESENKLASDVTEMLNMFIQQFNEIVEGIEEGSEEFQDSVIAGIIQDIDTQTRAALDALYAGQTTTNSDVATFIVQEGGPTRAALDSLYGGQGFGDADIAEIVSDNESITRGKLDGLYAGQKTSNSEVAGYVTNPGETKSALDSAYGNQAPTNADIANFISVPGPTRTTLDTLYADQELSDSDVATLIESETSETRQVLDSLYQGGVAPGGAKPTVGPFVNIITPFRRLSTSRVVTLKGWGSGFYGLSVDDSDSVSDEWYFVTSNGVDFKGSAVASAPKFASPTIAYDGATYVVNLAGDAYTSADGESWTQHDSVSGIEEIEYSFISNLFIAKLSGNKLATSPNGYDWTTRVEQGTIHPIESVNVAAPEVGLAEGAGKIVVGTRGWESWPPSGAPRSGVLVSSDGLSWSTILFPTESDTAVSNVLFMSGRFYATRPDWDAGKIDVFVSENGGGWEIIASVGESVFAKHGDLALAHSLDGGILSYVATKDFLSFEAGLIEAKNVVAGSKGTIVACNDVHVLAYESDSQPGAVQTDLQARIALIS